MIFKIFRDVLLLTILVIAMSKFANTQEVNDGGLRLKNGCYSLVIVVESSEGKKQITVQDCRGGRKIWDKLV